MGRRLPVSRPPTARIIHYLDPATPAQPAYPVHPAQLASQRKRQAVLYARWKKRQDAIAARDRKLRRFWLGFGAVIGLAVLGLLVAAGWLLWAVLGLGLLAVPALVVIVAALAVGGHRCITVVQHWH
jgi:fatty acid desaturase